MIHDISPPILDALEIWPSDTPPSREVMLDMKRGANLTLSSRREGPIGSNGRHLGLGTASLDDYVGSCQVIRVDVAAGSLVDLQHVNEKIVSQRVLFATGTFTTSKRFNPNFAALSPELIRGLHEQGVRLIGIDTPSVDPFDSKDFPARQAAVEANLAILEGVVLADVPAGVYELIALPLRLHGFDASPVRAILRTLPH